jgi:hypothetical protein
MKHFFPSLAALTAIVVMGAGCSSSSSPTPSTPSTPPSAGAGMDIFGGSDQASNVPSDIPVYPGSTVLSVTGDQYQTSVAQVTPAKTDVVTAWVRQQFTAKNTRLTNTDSNASGSSKTYTYEGEGKRYEVRVDTPEGNGDALLTIKRRNR